MKIRAKPQKPKREKRYERFSITHGVSLSSVVRWAQDRSLPWDLIRVDFDHYDDTYSFVASIDESDEEYSARLKRYQKRLADYEAWYAASAEAIEAEQHRRAEIARKRKLNAAQADLARARKEVERLAREVEAKNS